MPKHSEMTPAGLGAREIPPTDLMVGERIRASHGRMAHRRARTIQGKEALVEEGPVVEEEVLGGALPQLLPCHRLAPIPRRQAEEEAMAAQMVARVAAQMVIQMAAQEAVLEDQAVSLAERAVPLMGSSGPIQRWWPSWSELYKSKRETNDISITGRSQIARRGFGFDETSLKLVRKTATSCCWSSTSSKRCLRGPILVTRRIGP